MTWSFRTNGDYINFVHTDSTSLQVENILYTLHNSSRSVGWVYSTNPDVISFNIFDNYFADVPIVEIDFDGVAMTTQTDFETGIEAMFTGLTGPDDGGLGYLVYKALILQSGTNAPTVNILTNTIGAIVWQYDSVGYYIGELAGAFPTQKTFCLTGGVPGGTVELSRATSDYVQLQTFNAAGSPNNSMLSNEGLSVEIQVHP